MYLLLNSIVLKNLKILCLTGECPNATLCYKQRTTFFSPKFDQIRPNIATF